jgi:tetratricopeptide (TPR) repeat protein
MSELDLSNRTARLCLAGTQAEFGRRFDEARALFREAWEAANDDCEAAMAAHYIAHLEPEAQEALRWNIIAVERARKDQRADGLLGSLYVSLGDAYERVGQHVEAERYFDLAAQRGVVHQRDR